MTGAPTPDPFSARQLQAIRRLVDRRLASEFARVRVPLGEDIRNLRLAKTVERDGTYPATGDTFAIRLIDCGFTAKAPGSSTMSCKERTAEGDTDDADDVIAREINGQYVPEGTYVAALWQRGLEGDPDDYGEWWIRVNGAYGCWVWVDHFNRTASTNLGSDWNEVTGDWEIVEAGYGDLCSSCAPPFNQLHEEQGTAIGEGGTSGAIVIGTNPEPEDSAGQQYLGVYVYNPQVDDVFYLYPCCPSTSTTNLEVKFTFLGSDHEWLVEVGAESKQITGRNLLLEDGYYAYHLRVCADHTTNDEDELLKSMVKAWVEGYDPPLWLDDVDPGDGRYYGLGHGNTDTGAVFDDFSVSELYNEMESCVDCWCSCQGVPPTKHLHAEIHLGENRAACLTDFGWDMTYLDGTGDATPNHWQGIASFPNIDGTTFRDVLWHLSCGADDDADPAWPGHNFRLYTGETDGGCTHMISAGSMIPNASLSVCEPLELWFGPYTLTIGDLICHICYDPGDPLPPDPDWTGTYWIVITEAGA